MMDTDMRFEEFITLYQANAPKIREMYEEHYKQVVEQAECDCDEQDCSICLERGQDAKPRNLQDIKEEVSSYTPHNPVRMGYEKAVEDIESLIRNRIKELEYHIQTKCNYTTQHDASTDEWDYKCPDCGPQRAMADALKELLRGHNQSKTDSEV